MKQLTKPIIAATILAGLLLLVAGSSSRAASGGRIEEAPAAGPAVDATPVAATQLPEAPATPLSEVAERWGVEILALRLTAAGNMIDLRYRIVDPDKAAPLVDRTIKAYLLDQKSGRAVGVPNTAKVGPLRQTTKYGKPPADRVFFMLFANPGGVIESGSRMTLAVGDLRVENLVLM